MNPIRSRLLGTGSFLPPRRLTNADLVAELAQRGVESSDEWIVERTGIRARHFAAPDMGASDLGLEAAKRAAVGHQNEVRAECIERVAVIAGQHDINFIPAVCKCEHVHFCIRDGLVHIGTPVTLLVVF